MTIKTTADIVYDCTFPKIKINPLKEWIGVIDIREAIDKVFKFHKIRENFNLSDNI